MRNYKRIPFQHLHNCRDLGGYGCENDGMIKYNKVYRADSLSELTEKEWDLVEEIGIGTIIDLRSLREQEYASYTAPEAIKVLLMPMQSEGVRMHSFEDDMKQLANSFGESLFVGYKHMIKKNTKRIANILNVIAENIDKGAVLYHCSAGKDRTGVISAIIYKLCDVCNEDIIADYQVTETYNSKNIAFKTIPEAYKKLMNSDASNMIEFLELYDDIKAEELLYSDGLDKEKVEKLKKSIIEY